MAEKKTKSPISQNKLSNKESKTTKPLPKKQKIERAAQVIALLNKRYENPETLLNFTTPWELLVATVLAAQCTDKRVNMVTPALFERFKDVQAFAKADLGELEKYIQSTGFYHNKAKNIIAAAKIITSEYNDIVPQTMDELVKLPGLGRKTANCVLCGAFGINLGIAVDTHVKRIVYRLGLTSETDPDKVEKDLLLLFKKEEWGNVNHKMVWFGRHVCDAKKPLCKECEMNDFCPKIDVKS